MKMKYIFLSLASLFIFVAATSSQAVSAAECGGVTTNIIGCKQTGQGYCGTTIVSKTDMDNSGYRCPDGTKPVVATEETGIWGVLLLAINILTAGIGIAAVGGIIYGALLYTTSNGNPEQTKKGMEIIKNVVIGLIAYFLMFAILNFIIPGGVFKS
jgi:hypothetical protein